MMAYSPDSFRMGRIVSALRPIVRMHRDPADRSAQRWWSRRIRDFGPAGVVPLTFSIPSEEGEFVIRKLGNDVRRYEELAVLAKEQPDTPLGELCRATDRFTRAHETGHTHGTVAVGYVQEVPDRPRSGLPDLDAIQDAWSSNTNTNP